MKKVIVSKGNNYKKYLYLLFIIQRNTNEPTDSLSHSTGFPAK